MHAILIERHGGTEVMDWVEVPDPVPGSGELLVRIGDAGVNFVDTYQRSGLYAIPVPFIPGQEGWGVVVEGGPDTTTPPGTRVAWANVRGSYAELAAVTEERTVEVPEDVDGALAAAVLLQGLTAHYLVNDTYPPQAGDRCLVHAGAGGVGRLLIQMAKERGAEVFATVGSPEKADVAADAGADHVIDYRQDDFAAAVEAVAGPRSLAVVYDGVGRATFDRGLGLLRPRGVMVAFGNASGPVDPVDPLRLSGGGSLYLTRPTLGHHIPDAASLRRRSADLFAAIGEGRLRVLIGATFPLSEARAAHEALEGRETVGKVLLHAGSVV